VARLLAGGPTGVKRVLVLFAALLAAIAAVQGSQAVFTASATNAGSSFATAADWDGPAVTLTTPADGSAINDTTPTLSGAAGNASGDSTTVTVKIYSGSSATGTPVQTKTPSRGSGATWMTTASTLAAGIYTAQATQTDTAGNTGTSSANTFTIDTTKPTVSSVSAANKTGGTAGKIENGDTATFSYSEAIDPTSVLAGWDGTSTAVKLRFTNSTTDSFTVLDSNSQANVHLGTVATKGNYVTTTTTFSATMAMSADGTSVVVTLGTPTGVASSANTAKNMVWTFSTSIKDLAGNAITTSPSTWTESDSDRDF
jgi:hypothetical protein